MTHNEAWTLIAEASGYGDTGSSVAADDYTCDLIDRLAEALEDLIAQAS
jgi:hypothetical protein